MNRCAVPRRALVAVLVAALAGASRAQSVPTRAFPGNALRGRMKFGLPPEVLLNDAPRRLAPGARIRGVDNRIVLSGTLAGQRLWVHYTQDGGGLVQDVWLLTEAELDREPWPTTPEQAQAWRFDAAAQSWSR